MITLAAATPKAVRAFHAIAIAASGSGEGEPGLRIEHASDWYAASIRDPDGGKLV